MKIDIISAVPDLLFSPLNFSIVKRARESDLVQINIIDLRDYSLNRYGQIDDYQFGGGAGMVLMVEPLFNCISELKKSNQYNHLIYLTPDGEKFDQKHANCLSMSENLLLICGHYKGIDERIRDNFVTMELSIGDYVLSGGELAAAVLIDSIVRLIPGVLTDIESALTDSFQDNLLSPPVYSRPAEFNGWKVPEILLSGHEEKIREWRLEQSLKRTEQRRPDLLKDFDSL
ncbi:MAG: tRNA (guanosine(37)-N1)-methyltransferase TrmD [Saprospiraceae bacterium]|nr:tRNA (guanosine(37)-N1)-methyltransferase TrmD [Saprospiraceae bacterium]